MLGQHLRRAPSSDSRIFVYEVTGLHQNEITQYQNQPIRKSHSQFIQVPFNRMNEEMQRITVANGEIVRIFPLGTDLLATNTDTDADQSPAHTED